MKKLYALIAILCCATLAHAAGKALRVELNDGKTALYTLSSQPVVTFAGNDLTIKSADAETSYARADVRNFTFVDAQSGIADLTGTTRYTYQDNVFSCPGHDIEAFDLNGTRAACGKDAVSLGSLPDGVYIIRANNQSIKVTKK